MNLQHRRMVHMDTYPAGKRHRESFPPFHEESTPETWAISYADLLMVILSFFVLFFSLESKDEKSQNILLEQISSSIKKSNIVAKAISNPANTAGLDSNLQPNNEGGTAQEMKQSSVPTLSKKLNNILETLSNNKVLTNVEKNYLIVHLPLNLYRPGEFQVNSNVSRELNSVFNLLRPYFSDISVTVIGHSDADKFISINKYIQDNFGLSSLRAAHALKLAIKNGFPPGELYATGTAENLKNSRTLSIKIQLKGAWK